MSETLPGPPGLPLVVRPLDFMALVPTHPRLPPHRVRDGPSEPSLAHRGIDRVRLGPALLGRDFGEERRVQGRRQPARVLGAAGSHSQFRELGQRAVFGLAARGRGIVVVVGGGGGAVGGGRVAVLEVECRVDKLDVDTVHAELPVEVVGAQLKVGQERDTAGRLWRG